MLFLLLGKDGEYHPVYDFLATGPQTINEILNLAQKDGLAVLYKDLLTRYEERSGILKANTYDFNQCPPV